MERKINFKDKYNNIDFVKIIKKKLNFETFNKIENRINDEIKYLEEEKQLDFLKLSYILKQKANLDREILYIGMRSTNTLIIPYLLDLYIENLTCNIDDSTIMNDLKYRTVIVEDSYINEISKYVEEIIEDKVEYIKGNNTFEGTKKQPLLLKIEKNEDITFMDIFFDLEGK